MKALRPARGYTLLELLVGLAIAAIVMLPLTDMLRAGADNARFVRTELDRNADARFAIGRIAAQATRNGPMPGPIPGPATAGNPAAWLAPLQYTLQNGVLLETDPDAKPVRQSVLATSVQSFALDIPDNGVGQPVLRIDLVLVRPNCDANGVQACSTVYARNVRLGLPL
ncbi:prepilin-type N-terminal cleavage/methylation domain-containing protein [Massilia sp. MP_M2]|uniref:PulJ/GspJ family protein n=1 Tax=Massilia sp. MP_M2 TaxID=3071713 RepID=UPI00319E8E0E